MQFLLNLGLESLHVRMERHCANALKVAEFLQNNDKISWVEYPGLESSKYYKIAKKYMPNGTCGVISFGVKGGKEAASKFMKGLKIAAIETHGCRCTHMLPASCKYDTRQMMKQSLMRGVSGVW